MKTILITGASSGIGKATAKWFAARNWNVVATMRSPQNETELNHIPNIKLYALDVCDEPSIHTAIQNAISDFGKIDVLFNNAGFAAVGPFEASDQQIMRQQFNTNVFGVMNVTRAILPYFRAQKGGSIITTTSVGGLITFPLYSLYHSTKWAVEGFMESLHYELRYHNIRVKCVEPGPIKTDFYDRSMQVFSKPGLTVYDNYFNTGMSNMNKVAANGPGPDVVAQKVFKAANSNNFRLRYPVGAREKFVLFLRRMLPGSWYFAMTRKIVEKGWKKSRS